MLPKLLFRLLPEYYPPGTAYGHFPFLVTETARGFMSKLGCSEDDYVWTRPTKTPLGLGSIEDRVQKLVPFPLVSVRLRKIMLFSVRTDCDAGEEVPLLGQSGGPHGFLVLQHYEKIDRGKVRAGHRHHDAAFEHRWGRCEPCPDLLDH